MVGGGAFVCDGATDPSQVFGDIKSVRRLVDAGALPFFRVKFSKRLPLRAGTTFIAPDVRGTTIADEPGCNILDVVADPVSERDDNFELDIVVLNAGVPVDTAGFRFSYVMFAGTAKPRDIA
jgi:hypothetical protein